MSTPKLDPVLCSSLTPGSAQTIAELSAGYRQREKKKRRKIEKEREIYRVIEIERHKKIEIERESHREIG